MSVAEIIEQIKSLSPEEQKRVFSFVHEVEGNAVSSSPGVRYADDQTFDAAVERVFERHEELFKKLAQ